MLDVIVAGAGPAGAIAALVLARAGARVLIVDRESFPRHKLCGDTLNPGAVELLGSLGLSGGPLATGRPLAGMILTGPGAAIRATYPGARGLAVTRRELDAWLLDHALGAGARFEPSLVVRGPLVDGSNGRPLVRGLVLARRHQPDRLIRMPATLTIAADGRRSAAARALGLIWHPRRPRRWAFGVYATGVSGVGDEGEMHIRRPHYLGIAPLSDTLSNVCVVTRIRPGGRSPLDVVRRAIEYDKGIRARFETARFESPVSVLGPLAVDARDAGVEGMLLAGDAAGFVDPMTGDGLSLAMRGAQLAAEEALIAIEHGDFGGAVDRLRQRRSAALGSKLRFNRVVRRIVDSPAALEVASWGASVAPALVQRAVCYAGDAA